MIVVVPAEHHIRANPISFSSNDDDDDDDNNNNNDDDDDDDDGDQYLAIAEPI